jgi:gas vesicle protein
MFKKSLLLVAAYILGVMTAPRSGKDTRKHVANKLVELKKEMKRGNK